MTKFKVGDRVRLTGEAWEKHGMREEVYSVKRIVGGVPHVAVDNGRHMGIYRDGMDYSATLVEPAPPPADTSKRLREYTDLAHDDAVVIAGVEMKVSTRIGNGELCLWRNGHNHPITDPLFADMLVDEVRRKPRTKKRLVFDEVICDDDSTKTETRDMARNIGGAMWFVGSGESVKSRNADGFTVFRLIEETEVPR